MDSFTDKLAICRTSHIMGAADGIAQLHVKTSGRLLKLRSGGGLTCGRVSPDFNPEEKETMMFRVHLLQSREINGKEKTIT